MAHPDDTANHSRLSHAFTEDGMLVEAAMHMWAQFHEGLVGAPTLTTSSDYAPSSPATSCADSEASSSVSGDEPWEPRFASPAASASDYGDSAWATADESPYPRPSTPFSTAPTPFFSSPRTYYSPEHTPLSSESSYSDTPRSTCPTPFANASPFSPAGTGTPYNSGASGTPTSPSSTYSTDSSTGHYDYDPSWPIDPQLLDPPMLVEAKMFTFLQQLAGSYHPTPHGTGITFQPPPPHKAPHQPQLSPQLQPHSQSLSQPYAPPSMAYNQHVQNIEHIQYIQYIQYIQNNQHTQRGPGAFYVAPAPTAAPSPGAFGPNLSNLDPTMVAELGLFCFVRLRQGNISPEIGLMLKLLLRHIQEKYGIPPGGVSF